MNTNDRWPDFSRPHSCFGPLLTPTQVLRKQAGSGIDYYDRQSTEALVGFARYVTEFLTSENSALGRKGAVCPYTSGALTRGLVYLSASPLGSLSPDLLVAAMEEMRGVFSDLGGQAVLDRGESMYKAIVVLLPMLSPDAAAETVETVQKRLKPAYIRDGLMIGEFYPGCPAPGLHNPDFRPLQTPVASLAIREITPFDAPFMVEDDLYVAGYLERFGKGGCDRLMATIKKMGGCVSGQRATRVAGMVDAWLAMNDRRTAHAAIV